MDNYGSSVLYYTFVEYWGTNSAFRGIIKAVINMTNEAMSAATKAKLAKVLKEKMLKKPLGKISVSEIALAADVNRKTFYYYFDDINSLLKWSFEEEALDVVRRLEDDMSYTEAIDFVIDYIEENDSVLSCAVGSLGIDGIRRFLYDDALNISRKLISDAESERGISLDPDYKNFLTLFLTNAIVGILLERIGSRTAVNREKIITYLTRIFNTLLTQPPADSE